MIAAPLRSEAQRAADEFRAFHERLVAIQARIAAPMANAPDAGPIRRELAEAIGALGYVPVRAPDALRIDSGYVLAAFADELLLTRCAAWAEAEGWDREPLEAALYGTALAGDRVFAAADALVEGRRDDLPTATTLLLALMMGMRGKWLGRDDRGTLVQLRAALYGIVTGTVYVADDDAPYQRASLRPTTLTGASDRRLPTLWPWLTALAAVILLYLPVSHLVWYSQVKQADGAAQAINHPETVPTTAAGASPTPRPAPATPLPLPKARRQAPAAPALSIPDPLDLPSGNAAARTGDDR